MKREILLVICCLGFFWSYSQYTTIPDVNFEQFLITNNIDSEGGPTDGQVLTVDINAIVNLDISNQNIADLTGLEAFTALETLDVSDNNLNSLRIQNLNLTIIRANNCNLAGKSIRFQNNPDTGSFLNNVATLELKNNNLGDSSSTFNFGGVPNVTTLDVSGNNFGSIQLTVTTKIETLYLNDNPNLNSILNLDSLTELVTLDITNCAISNLVVASNPKLTTLRVGGNPLNTINLQSNPLLNSFTLEGTQINGIDFSQNANLGVLAINNSLITNIDLSNNLNLVYANIFNNSNLVSLNLANSNNQNLDTLLASSTPSLNCIQVDDINAAYTKPNWQIDPDSFYALDCIAESITIIPDSNFEQYLIDNNHDSDGIVNGRILSSEAEVVTELNLANLNIGNLTGIEGFVNLENLYANDNNLSTIDITSNSKLMLLDLSYNTISTIDLSNNLDLELLHLTGTGLTSFDISKNTKLTSLFADALSLTSVNISENPAIETLSLNTNNLSSLDISMQPNLFHLNISFNSLTALDVSQNPLLNDLYATDNPSLSCIKVTNVANAESQANWLIDATTSYSLDCSSTTPYSIITTIVGAGTNPDYAITEGDSFTINFDADNTATNGEQYTPIVAFSINGIPATDDFLFEGDTTIPTAPFTVSANNPDGSITVEAIDDGNVEGDEVYTITVTSSDASNYTMAGPATFTITVKDRIVATPFIVSTNLVGAGTGPNYEITEGNSFTINFDADNTATDGDQYTPIIAFSINGNPATDDFLFNGADTIPNTPFTVSTNNPDGSITVAAKDDGAFEGDEVYTIAITSSDTSSYTLAAPATFTVTVKDQAVGGATIVAVIDNTGGTEGGTDTFTLSLKNIDGSVYTDEENLVFDISFTPDTDRDPSEWAETTDYIVPLPSQINIPAGASSGSITIELPQETSVDDQHEFYLATVMQPSPSINVTLPPPFQAKIIDDEGRFDVFYTINNEILIEADDTGNGCCPYYIVEEGSTISFSFNAEKGALEDNPYEIEIGYSPGASNPGTNPNAMETDDYYTAVGPNDRLKRIFEFDVDDDFENPSGNPDNRLSVKIRDDDGEDDSESFTISISKANALDQFNLIPSSSIYSMEFTIIETIQASIIASDDIADEEDYQNDKGLFTIRLDEEAKTEMEVTYIIEESEESATNGQDYLLIDGSVLFMQGETEKTIEIEAIPDDIPEEEERITIELIDGPGYSINTSSDRATVTIPKNDQDKVQFEVTLTTIDAQIYEDPTQKNSGVFEFTIEPPNTSGIDLVVNYAFIENGQSSPATEGAGNDFTQNGTGTLVFPSGGPNIQNIEVTALEDPDVGTENTEVITLSLTEGNRYNASNTQNATMEIISTEFDRNSLSSEALQVTVATNTCANTNEGDIIIKNSSQFTFIATVSFENKSVIISGNSEETIKDLPAGRHPVTFAFEDESIELIPPEFEVLIAALEGTNLTGKHVDLTSKTASLQVSGSRKYSVLNGEEAHFFEFSDFKEKRISIPLKNGENNIKILGEAACQGVIETNLYLNEFVVFPNPTSHLVTLSGFLFEEEAQLTIYDLSGKVFLAKELTISNGSIKVDLSEYPSGLYYGKIVSDSNQDFSFKLLKK